MKTIYLVRHGESEGNVGPIHQTHTELLTPNGRRQAALLGERFSKIEIDVVICSTAVRAKETADFILEKNPTPVEYSDIFIERRRPSSHAGVAKDDPDAIETEQSILDNFHVPGFRHSDEENFEDLKDRARKAFEYLVARPEDRIAVVTHGMFLRVMAAYLMFGEKLTSRECNQFMWKMSTENTCISVFRYQKDLPDRNWQMMRWNDHAHLG